MYIPASEIVREAVVVAITPEEYGHYVVRIRFDGSEELFHIELDGLKASFSAQERRLFSDYFRRCPTLKGLVPLMRRWHRGVHERLPIDLARVDFV